MDAETESRPVGRPSKLTPDVEARILNAVRCGAPNRVACLAAGVGESTLYQWLEKAKSLPYSEYAEFAERLKQARHEGITARLAIIMKAARSSWQAASWLLERDLPDVYSLKHRVEHSVAPMSIADALSALRKERDSRVSAPEIDVPDAGQDHEEEEL